MSLISFSQVNFIYAMNTPFEQHALKDINLSFEKGSFTAIVGHTGSGKSTLVQHLNGLLQPSSGAIQVKDYVIHQGKLKHGKALKQLVGLVFQFPEYQLFEETVLKDVMFGPKNFGDNEEEASKKAKEALKKVGIEEKYYESSPFELSGGQKRRVAIAGIIALHPEVLVLDEPTAGLDPNGVSEMMKLFCDLNKSGVTIILVTHDMDLVFQYADRMVIVQEGKILKTGDPSFLFADEKLMEEASLEVPTLYSFLNKMKKQGFEPKKPIKSMDDLVQEIVEMRRAK